MMALEGIEILDLSAGGYKTRPYKIMYVETTNGTHVVAEFISASTGEGGVDL